MESLSRQKRINLLKERMLRQKRYMSIEQALITTRIYQENEEKPVIIKRALALKAALQEMEIAIEPEELIVGNRTKGVRYGVVSPESGGLWIDKELETLPTRSQDKFNVKGADIKTYREVIKPYWQGKSLEDILKDKFGEEFSAISKVAKINQTDHSQGHICPDCDLWLQMGPEQIKQQAQQKLQSENLTNKQQNFYKAIIITMDGAQIFMHRYSELLKQMAAENTQYKKNLLEMADICGFIANNAPESFHQAVQSLWFLFVILQMESNASSFSPGRMDRYLYLFYKRDIDKGSLDKEKALTIIECLWLKFNQIVYMRNTNSAKYFAGFPIGFNIAIGGLDENGNAAENDLSYMFLQAQEDLGLPQPNLSVRLNKNTSQNLLEKSIAVVAKGSGMPQFFNDEAVVDTMIESLQIAPKDALDYAIVGCVELTTQGNNLGWSDAAMFNLNKALELAMNHGKCLLTGRQMGLDIGGLDTYDSFEELENAFAGQIDYFMGKMIKACAEVEQGHMDLLPSPFLSAVIDDCMEKGLDVTAGGAHYNLSGIQIIQAANIADSMAVLYQLIYKEKRITGTEMLTALQKNFQGYPVIKAMVENKVAKYGNDVKWVDNIAVKWAQYFREKLTHYKNHRGGLYHTGMYTVSAHVPMGENVGATPDGRLAEQPLADGGMSPVYGRDAAGPTAVLQSVGRLDNNLTSNGGLLNMKFLPEFFATEQGIKKFAMFLRTFVDLKIPHIQFNVLHKEDLQEAKKNPEKYRSLTVRVAGYTAYFTELDGKLQDEIIARTQYDAV
ncbi:glycyl radical protein [Pectinatus brassicae]|uniref:Formate C-acetyltransferase n=1 Tax=Pectinatus brassicae TaxID=862415 RepID=A0A840UIW7_9FIRM|nr:formate C-acetyltransferase/glycerol dehydratase family glycyl radical enzyme [Pectinatus brassicae]MBB5335547.1 formate C-acetyltransferase [Pectinatus brassicae]